jgi:hypothetical protein
MLGAVNETKPGNVIMLVCWGAFGRRMGITFQWKVRESVSEEVMLRLRLNDKKEVSIQDFEERQRKS